MIVPHPPPEGQAPVLAQLRTLRQTTAQPLYQINTRFPYQFWPIVLTLDRQKLTISRHFWGRGKQVEQHLLTDVVSVSTNESWWFAALTVVVGRQHNTTITIPHLAKAEAKKMRRLIEGLLIVENEQLDITQVEHGQLLPELEQIGSTRA